MTFVPLKGYSKYIISDTGVVKRLKGNRTLIQSYHPQGYKRVTITTDSGIRKTCMVHRLVCASFHVNPTNKSTVNHKNGIKDDNRKENLEWMTQEENQLHAVKTGLFNEVGENNGNSKLTSKDVEMIRKRLDNGELHRNIAKDYRVNQSTISHIKTGHTWKEK